MLTLNINELTYRLYSKNFRYLNLWKNNCLKMCAIHLPAKYLYTMSPLIEHFAFPKSSYFSSISICVVLHTMLFCFYFGEWKEVKTPSHSFTNSCFPALKLNIAMSEKKSLGKMLFRKRSDKMRRELEDAAREGSSRRSNSPIPILPVNDRASDLSDLTGNASKAAGFYSDAVPKHVHLKFVSLFHFSFFF